MPEQLSALAGIRVVDFTHFIAGPFCTMILADLGAEVIKIEGPAGDAFRALKPHVANEGAPYLWVNRNKSGVVLNFAPERGRELVRDMIATADVVVENFSTGVMARYGLDYETVSKTNPKLVYCSISAYGRQGPLADRIGLDPVVQAESGFMSMNGHPDQEMTRTSPAIMDVSTGMMAANAVLGALMARERHIPTSEQWLRGTTARLIIGYGMCPGSDTTGQRCSIRRVGLRRCLTSPRDALLGRRPDAHWRDERNS